MWSALFAVLVLVSAQAGQAQKFYPDDPIQVDPDRMDVPPPSATELSDVGEFLRYTFLKPNSGGGEALNINTAGEVPNSSWYNMRHYYDSMSLEELKRGPDETGPPEPPLEVVSGKEEGKSVGMQVVDARGERYLLKFDPKRYPELSSSAEVIVTKFFYALGYNVPENYVTYFDRNDLTIREDTEEEDYPDAAFIDRLLDKVPTYSSGKGRYRALASLFIQGKQPLGPFILHGTRPDDANDIFPHEDRREIRGLRVFGSWIDHIDIRSSNSLDMYVEEDGRSFVRHYLIDFGSTLGGGPVSLKRRWFGREYILQPAAILTRLLTLGFFGDSWVDIDYPDDITSVGRIQGEEFKPKNWRGQNPNPPFTNADAGDHFWAAKQVRNFTEREIRAIVKQGQYSNPEAVDYLTKTLVERRNKIGRAYLDYAGGLDRFAVEDGALTFEDLAAKYGYREEGRTRIVTWRPFDNQAEETGSVITSSEMQGTSLQIPDSDAAFLQVEIETPTFGTNRVFLRRTDAGYEVVGVEREGKPLGD
jgi:hypothetical protein